MRAETAPTIESACFSVPPSCVTDFAAFSMRRAAARSARPSESTGTERTMTSKASVGAARISVRNDASIFVGSKELAAAGVTVSPSSSATVIVAVSQRIPRRITFSLYSPPALEYRSSRRK